MIDTHCHLLPGLDDGPMRLADSIGMARALVAAGVDHVVCTPHYSERYPVTVERARQQLDRLRAALDELSVPLGLSLAAEVAPATALRAPLDELLIRAIGGRFLLVELVARTRATEVLRCLDRLEPVGLSIVLAHPERSVEVQTRPEVVERLREGGAVVQVVAPSLMGVAPAGVGRAAWQLVDTGNVDAVGSDAHRPGSKRLRLGALADVVAHRVGAAESDRVFCRTPQQLVSGVVPGRC